MALMPVSTWMKAKRPRFCSLASARMVRNEVVSEYGSALPANIQTLAIAVDDKMKALEGARSIRGSAWDLSLA